MLIRLSTAIVRRLPPVVIRDTERLGLSLSFIFLAVASATAAFTQRNVGRVESIVPPWVYLEWSATLFAGGVLTIWGMLISHRLLERTGVLLSGIGCATYGLALISTAHGDPRTWVVGVLFLILTVVKTIRLLASTAAEATREELQP